MDDDDELDAYLNKVRARIDAHGHAVQQVATTEEGEPGWSYTIGLHAEGLPELIIVGGVSRREQGAILNRLAQRMRAGERLEVGVRDDNVLEGVDVTYLEVDDTTTSDFAVAVKLQERFRALQVVWPDLENRFPWEPGHSMPPTEQRLLGTPPS